MLAVLAKTVRPSLRTEADQRANPEVLFRGLLRSCLADARLILFPAPSWFQWTW